MKHLLIPLTIAVMLLTGLKPAFAEIPRYMQFQGKATDAQDVPLNGPYALTFRIYDTETGGTPIWSETHSVVSVENGVFSVILGGVNTLDLSFDKQYWISIEVDTTDGTGEMPRQMITSVGYAYRAKEADYTASAASAEHVNVDNVTIEESKGQLSVKDGGITQAKLAHTSAGDVLIFSSDSEKSTPSQSPAKLKEIIIGRTGSLRLRFDFRCNYWYNGARAQIYRNGEAVGIEHVTHSESYQTFSEDIVGWQVGDKCQLYVWSSHGCYVKNFRLYSSEAMQYIDNEL